ncbi:uncharacterized protein E5676_scaffold218G00570 [Cucumis melo var. makuwa]|uniref:Transposase n=1 Tax=Cucumis melo var. makuwa TaxID=1194695 RepID=A0A5A7VE47_CUCMM|nr:uncharacterized protein E6C27_scaffold548G001030 [Cucumis melo var. makuwa]TYK02854.1 uncharacterized protein E5676_scaffold218G00570 [Cucumis melo var. makuwa]
MKVLSRVDRYSLGYETIHACKYDCVLYLKEFADFQHCPTCGEARNKFTTMECMKKKNVSMSLLIPNPRSSDKETDVYLQPLIEELKELWNFGLRTYDFLTGQFFQQHAALLWTINDFPTYGDLSRWSIKGYQACPICMGDRSSFGIRGRISFMGHRHYLPENHMWHGSKLHDGKVKHRALPVVMNGYEILE